MKTVFGPAVLFETALVGVAWGIGALVGHRPFAGASLTGWTMAWGMAATGPPLVGLWLLARWDWSPMRRLFHAMHELLGPLFAACSTAQLAIIAVAAGIGEEALFRGVLQVALEERWGAAAGLGLASAAFGAAHFITPLYAVIAGIMGLYLGALFLAFDNVAVPIIVHTLYDFGALVWLVRSWRARTPERTEERT